MSRLGCNSPPLPLPFPVSSSLIRRRKLSPTSPSTKTPIPAPNRSFQFHTQNPNSTHQFLTIPFSSPQFEIYGSPINLLVPFCSNSTPSVSVGENFDVELGRMLSLLPKEIRCKISEHLGRHLLIEVVMDLGRKSLARFPSGDLVLSDSLVNIILAHHV